MACPAEGTGYAKAQGCRDTCGPAAEGGVLGRTLVLRVSYVPQAVGSRDVWVNLRHGRGPSLASLWLTCKAVPCVLPLPGGSAAQPAESEKEVVLPSFLQLLLPALCGYDRLLPVAVSSPQAGHQ